MYWSRLSLKVLSPRSHILSYHSNIHQTYHISTVQGLPCVPDVLQEYLFIKQLITICKHDKGPPSLLCFLDFQYFLLRPLCRVLNFLMKYSSRSYLCCLCLFFCTDFLLGFLRNMFQPVYHVWLFVFTHFACLGFMLCIFVLVQGV